MQASMTMYSICREMTGSFPAYEIGGWPSHWLATFDNFDAGFNLSEFEVAHFLNNYLFAWCVEILMWRLLKKRMHLIFENSRYLIFLTCLNIHLHLGIAIAVNREYAYEL